MSTCNNAQKKPGANTTTKEPTVYEILMKLL